MNLIQTIIYSTLTAAACSADVLNIKFMKDGDAVSTRPIIAVVEYGTKSEYVTRATDVSPDGMASFPEIEPEYADLKVSAVTTDGTVSFAGTIITPNDGSGAMVVSLKENATARTPSANLPIRPSLAVAPGRQESPAAEQSKDSYYGNIRQVSYGKAKNPTVIAAELSLRTPEAIANARIYGIPLRKGSKVSSVTDSRTPRETFVARIMNPDVTYSFAIKRVMEPGDMNFPPLNISARPLKVTEVKGMPGFTAARGTDFVNIIGQSGGYLLQGHAFVMPSAVASTDLAKIEAELIAGLKSLE